MIFIKTTCLDNTKPSSNEYKNVYVTRSTYVVIIFNGLWFLGSKVIEHLDNKDIKDIEIISPFTEDSYTERHQL